MKRAISRKPALLKSGIALLLCISMLMGSTFAWFTEQVSGDVNIIQSGSLDVEMQWAEEYDGENTVWNDAAGENAEPVFNYQNWEPGYTQVRYIKVSNEGNLAFKWLMSIIPTGKVGELASVIEVRYDVVTDNDSFVAPSKDNKLGTLKSAGTLADVISGEETVVSGILLPEGEKRDGYYSGEIIACITLHMQETAGNEYQSQSVGDAFNILLKATQYNYELDSYDKYYDKEAVDMELLPPVTTSNKTSNTKDVTIASEDGKASILIPAGSVGEKKVTFTISEGTMGSFSIDANAVDANAVGVGSTTVQTATYDIKLIDEDGNVLSTTDEKPFTITMYVGTGLDAVPVYHEGVLISGTTYNAETGYVTFSTTSFSEYEFQNVNFTYSGEYFDYSQDQVTIYNVGDLASLEGTSEYKATKNDSGKLTDSVLTLPGVGNYILFSTVKAYGEYTPLSVQVPEGSKVLLYNVSLAPLNGRDAINIVQSDKTNTSERTTYILLADNTNNHLDGRYDPDRPVTGTQYGATMGTEGRSGIGFGGGYAHEYDGKLVISGPKAAIYCDGAYNCPGIGGNRWDCGAFDITLKDIRFVHTYGGDNGAGIGSSQGVSNSWGNCGDIIVDLGANGYMDAKSGGNAASVGAGGNGSCDDIYFISGSTGCWVGHYASWTSIGRCCWSSQTGNIYFVGGSVNDARGGVDAGSSKIYFVAADDAAARATVWKNWSGPIKSSASNVIYGYKGLPTSMSIDGTTFYTVGSTVVVNSITVNYQYAQPQTKTEGFSIGSVDMTTGGRKTVTVSYEEYGHTITGTLEIVVKDEFNAIVASPKKSVYNINDEVTVADFNVSAVASDGTKGDISGYTISSVDTSTAGTQKVTISYVNPSTGNVISVDVNITVRNLNKVLGNKVPTVQYWHAGNFAASNNWNHMEQPGTGYESFVGKTYTGANGEISSGFNLTGHTAAQPMSGYNNLTVTNAKQFSMIGINGTIRFGNASIKSMGYYVDGDISTVKTNAELSDAGSGNTAYVLKANLYDFAPGSTHTITYVVEIDEGFIDLCQWTVTMAPASNDAFVDTDKPNVNVIVIAGQSNACGASPITQSLKNQYSSVNYHNVYMQYKNTYVEGNIIGTACESSAFEKYYFGMGGFQSQHFGPEAGLAHYLATNEATKNEQWFIIKYAATGTTITQWNSGVNLANEMTSYVKACIGQLTSDYDVQVRGLLWMQGETDGVREDWANAYKENEQILVNKVRTELAAYATRTDANVPGSGIAFIDAAIAPNHKNGQLQNGVPGTNFENGGLNDWVYGATINWAKFYNTEYWYLPTVTGGGSVFGGTIAAGWYYTNQGAPGIINSAYIDTYTLISKNDAPASEKAEYVVATDPTDWAHYSSASMMTLGEWFGEALIYVMGKDTTTENSSASANKTTYTVKYNANGGNISPDNIIVVAGKSIVLLPATREDYTFKGWSDGTKTYAAGAEYTVTGNVTLTAQWEASYYTVTYNANGGSVNKTSDKVYIGQSVTMPTPTRSGYRFDGWVNGSGATYNGGESHAFNADTTLTAQWLKLYTITVEQNGATVTLINGNSFVEGEQVQYNVVFTHEDNQTCLVTDENGVSVTFTNPSGTIPVTFNMPASNVTISASSEQKPDDSDDNGNGCVTPDTLITLADGSQKRIDQLAYTDELLVWDFNEGKYVSKPAAILINMGEGYYDVISLTFENGTVLKMIDVHGFFDMSLNKFVFINKSNVKDFVGHNFAISNADGFEAVKLVDYSVSYEHTVAYSVFSAEHYNAIAEGVLSITPYPGVDNEAFYDCWSYDENMMYDFAEMQKKIDKHGLFTYEDWKKYGVTYEQYVAANLAYIKVVIGEGALTFADAIDLIKGFMP